MATAVHDPLVGTTVDGRYRVRSRIARGGMATVYLATDTRLDRPVALKVMHAHLAEDSRFVARFAREARSAARLSHPGVVAVFDQGADAGTTYLAMEHVPGRTLRHVLAERGALALREALDAAEQVLDALAAAHAAGLVHRDVKPENVLVGDDGRLRVADFGLARAAVAASGTSASTLMGTVGYLAPELVLHGTADARADVYAAGVVLFELLTGTQPFTGGVPAQVAFRHVHEDVPLPSSLRADLPPELDDLVAWATDRDPARRPADAGLMLAGLRQVRAGLSPADLDRPPLLVLPATDGSTLVVDRDRVLPPPAGPAPSPAPAPSSTAPSPAAPSSTAPSSAAPAGSGAPGVPRPRRGSRRAPAGAHPAPRAGGPRLGGRRRGLVAALVVLVVALCATVAWAVVAGPLARVDVPPVAGATEGAARTQLRTAHLLAEVRRGYDSDVPAGHVVSTRPAAGTAVRRDSTVTVVLSRGPQLFTVPDLVGRSRRDAEALVTRAHLAVGAVAQEWSETAPAGTVVSQQTPVQPALAGGSPVAFTVSKGREPIGVPSVAGRPQDEAAGALRDAGLAVGDVTTEASDTVPQGAVVRQSPADGTLHRGDRVALVVSSGPPLVTVPGVVNHRLDDAQRQLQAAGLQVAVNRVFGGLLGVVRLQDPAGGQVRRGSTVTLTVV